MLHRLRGRGLYGARVRGWRRRRRHLVLEPLPGRPLRRGEPGVLLPFDDELQQEWDWSERFSPQPEILRLRRPRGRPVRSAPRHPVRHPGDAAAFDEETAGRWTVATDRGDEVTAQFVVMATGCLSSANIPRFPGMETLRRARRYHTGRWPHEGVDFSGQAGRRDRHRLVGRPGDPGHRRAGRAAHRVPAHRHVHDPGAQPARSTRRASRTVKADYAEFREQQPHRCPAVRARVVPANPTSALDVDAAGARARVRGRWSSGGPSFLGAFGDLMTNPEANDIAAEFVRRQDPRDRRGPGRSPTSCCRRSTVIGCKRLCLDTDYYETYNRPNVHAGRRRRRRRSRASRRAGIRDRRRASTSSTCIVFATGFDAMTGIAAARSTSGAADGLTPARAVARGPAHLPRPRRRRLPEPVHDHPGPGSPSVLTNMMASIEQHVKWIGDCLALPARPRDRLDRGDRSTPRTPGSTTSTRSPTDALSAPATRGTSARTSPEKRVLHAPDRLPALCRALQRSRGQGLRGRLPPGALVRRVRIMFARARRPR